MQDWLEMVSAEEDGQDVDIELLADHLERLSYGVSIS
jgi:hypothetical protein